MGYFDSVKPQRPPSLEVVANNVTPIRPRTEGLHPYAAGIRDAWLNRLDALPRPWYSGAAWDNNCFVTARKLIEVANSPWSGYSVSDAHADYMAHAPHDNVWDKREKCWDQALDKAAGATLPEPEPGTPIPDVTVLDLQVNDLEPDAEARFWAARPFLAHVEQFARARRVSPWAVLGVALLRVVTATPHQVCLPPTIGGKGSLNQFVGLVGPSGSGKGAAESVAAEAVHVGHIESHSVGSGEGIAHGYMHRKRGELHWNDDAHAVLFSVPEIDSLTALGDRKGATLMPQLRSAWSGERLGFSYADPTKRILIPAHEYRMCLVAGIQPARAGALLDDADGGTPQRFLWMPAIDPTAPDTPPAEPSPLTWEPPRLGTLNTVGGIRMNVCDKARRTIIDNRLPQLRGQVESLDGHALQTQLKTAAALALTESRLNVTDEDWDLAGTVMAKSAAVRSAVAQTLRAKASEANYARADAEASRQVHVTEKLADAAVKRVCNVVLRRLRREGDWVPRGVLRVAVAGRDREHFETAVDRLVDAGQIEAERDTRTERFRVAKGADE